MGNRTPVALMKIVNLGLGHAAIFDHSCVSGYGNMS